MRLLQLIHAGDRRVAATDDAGAWIVEGYATAYQLARAAINARVTLVDLVKRTERGASIDPAQALAEGRILSPIDHPDPAHLLVSGTGLTHLGSAAARDAMHAKIANAAEEKLTDSMKMFRMGLQRGKPRAGETGVQPEWFFKGDGSCVVAPGQPLVSPWFAEDAGEEPEVAGVYLIGDDAQPYRAGFVLLNEFSDHVIERQNYLWLAHSKLRPCSFGPELLLGELPADIRGSSRIRRNGALIFDQPFLTGEANMSHSIANLEAHQFKYRAFRRPGDVHIHTFGTGTLSFAAGIKTQPGDVFEIEAREFGLPLVNPLAIETQANVSMRAL
ncbi:MAG TPA: AraD1 family protein [Planctomycetota bacterium]|nr:AraD1 family protein [Planctomycetota bacterium]